MEETDLAQALNQLTEMVKSNDPKDRKKILMQKSLEGSTTAKEDEELLELMKGGTDDGKDSLVKSALAGLDPEANGDLESALEVSEYLKAHHQGTVGALEVVTNALEKSMAQQGGFNLQMAKTLVKIGEVVGELQKSMEAFGAQPASQPRAARSVPQAKAIQKSMAGGAPEGQRFSKSQYLDALDKMSEISRKEGRNGLSKGGEDITNAIAKYEGQGKMTRTLHAELLEILQG